MTFIPLSTWDRAPMFKKEYTELPSFASRDTSNDQLTQSPLDHPLAMTRFPDEKALRRKSFTKSLRQFRDDIEETQAGSKAELPFMKLARFGDQPSEKGSYRTNGNVESVTGVEIDYDAGEISPTRARAVFAESEVAALITTTASHMQPGKGNRWRAYLPFSREYDAEERARFVARLHGLFDGELAPESFVLSQSFYYGNVSGRPKVATYLVEGGYIDLAESLDEGAIGKDGKPYRDRVLERDSANDNDRSPMPLNELADIIYDLEYNEWCNGSRDLFLSVIMSVHHETGGSDSGMRLAQKWAKQSPKYNARDFRRDWNSFDGDAEHPITIASLIPHSPTYRAKQEAEHRAEVVAALNEEDEGEESVKPENSLTVLTPDECTISTHNPYVIKGLCGAGETMTIVGAPGVGKSAAAAYMAYSVAQGEPVFGTRTRQGKVFYIACENETDMKRRVRALRDRHGPADDFHLVLNGSGNMKKGSLYLRSLAAAVKRDRPILIVIDTLAAAMPGFEENSSEGMGQAIAVARSLAKYGAAVMIVHHDTKAGDGLPRGHSSLNGIVDANLSLRRDDGGVIRGVCSKNRSGKSHEQMLAYENSVVELGIDQDGDPITTVICEEMQGEWGHEPAPISGNPAKAFDILKSVAGDRSSASLDNWRTAAMDNEWLVSLDKPDTRRKTFRRAKEELEKRGWIEVTERGVRLTDPSRTGFSAEDFDDDEPQQSRRRNREELA